MLTRRALLWVAGPLLALIALALVAAAMLDPAPKPPVQAAAHDLRQPYSPNVLADPAFRKAQRRNLAALERACEEHGEFCAEAAGAAGAIDGSLGR